MDKQIDLMKKSILSKAFRGDWAQKNPGDETAIEVLTRSLKDYVNVLEGC